MGLGLFRFSIVLCAAVLGGALFLLRSRRDAAGKTVTVERIVWAQLAVTLLYLAENLASEIKTKVLFDSGQLLVDALIGPLFLSLSFRHSGRKSPGPERTLLGVGALSGFTAFVFTVVGSHLGFSRTSAALVPGELNSMQYEFETVDYLVFLELYTSAVVGALVLLRSGLLRHRAFLREAFFVSTGVTLPVLLSAFAFLHVGEERDISPFLFAVGTLVTVYGIVSGRVVDAIPMARELLVELQRDAILLLESTSTIIDSNAAARALLGNHDIVGRKLEDLLPSLGQLRPTQEPFVLERDDTVWEFNAHEIPDDRTLLIGRDVTTLREAEAALEAANAALEAKVEERTQALSAANRTLTQEIGERRTAEKRAAENSEKFRAIFDNSAIVLALLDPTGKVLEWNRAAGELFAESQGLPLVPLGDLDLWNKNPTAREKLLHALELAKEGRAFAFEATVESPHRRHLDCRVKPLGEQAVGERLLFEAHDVSELRETENHRAHLQTVLAHSDRMEMLGRLAGGVAHDFNNLLTVILAAAELLSDADLSGEERDAALDVLDAAEQASLVTRQLLAFSRIGGDTPSRLDAHVVLQHLSKVYARLLGERHRVEMLLRAPRSGLFLVPGHFEQCLTNLVVNARDAMPNGGIVTISTDVCEHPDQRISGEFLRVSIRDEGTGIPEAVRERVFEAFFTTKAEGEGTGLGLHTVRTLVSDAGGTIELDSSPGAGSTFSLLFPLQPPSERPQADTSLQPEIVGGSEVLFVVEDLTPLRERTARALRRLGYDVIAFESAEAVLSHIDAPASNDPRPALVVSDVLLPGIDGVMLTASLRERYPDLPVVFTTGYAGGRSIPGASESSTALLYKPYRLETLAQHVRRLLDHREVARIPTE